MGVNLMFILSAHGYVRHFVLFLFLSLSISLGLFKLIYLYLSQHAKLHKHALEPVQLKVFAASQGVRYINIVGQTAERQCTMEAVFFFFRICFVESRMLLFHEAQVQGGRATRLNWASSQCVSSHACKSCCTVGGWRCSSVNTVQYSTCVCVCVIESHARRRHCLLIQQNSLWFSCLFTDSVMLMYSCGSQGSFLPCGPRARPSRSRLTAHYSTITMLS